MRYRGAVSDTNRADNHYRIVGGDRLQWSGRMRAWQADPRWVRRGLVADIRRNFPALGKVEIAHLWSGTLGRAIHRMPQIGEIESGLWVASGFGGHGLNTTAMGGELIARGIVESDQTWRLFAPYELVWAGGVLGRVLAQGIYWGTRPIERIEQGLSRYREQWRSRKAARRAASVNGHEPPGRRRRPTWLRRPKSRLLPRRPDTATACSSVRKGCARVPPRMKPRTARFIVVASASPRWRLPAAPVPAG